jgi:type IV pilus assembly protein PilA
MYKKNGGVNMIKNKGFTLIEIMIVVAIIGVLAAIAIPRFLSTTDTARIRGCDANIVNINAQWELQELADGAYDTLANLLADTTYFPDGAPSCPLGDAYADSNSDNRVDAHGH